MATLWEKNGKLIENDAGTALLECENCPCETAAPCECPGEGLATSYLVTLLSGSFDNGILEYRWDGQEVTVTDPEPIGCSWTGTADVETRASGSGDPWVAGTATIAIVLVTDEPCHWGVGFTVPGASGGGTKDTGQTPEGTYSNAWSVD